jgi:hypothetical protein
MIAQIISSLIGIWLMFAPAVLNISGTAEDINHIFGPVIASAAIISWWEATRNLRLVNVIFGTWLIAVPFILSYEMNNEIINSIVCGAAVIILSLIKGKIEMKYNGGWKSLIKNN